MQKVFIEYRKDKVGEVNTVSWPINIFLIHFLLKLIISLWQSLAVIIQPIYGQVSFTQMFFVMLGIDFWFTKNISGRKLLGIRWYFGENKYGVQKLMFECRVNEKYEMLEFRMLFWITLITYTIFPIYHMRQILLVQSGITLLDFNQWFLFFSIIISGATNIYFFWIVTRETNKKRNQLKLKYNAAYIQMLGRASLHGQL